MSVLADFQILPKRLEHFIGGEWVSSPTSFHSLAPATGHVLGDVALGGRETIELAVSQAKRALPAWKRTSLKERSELLKRMAALLIQHQDEFARLETLDTGKPISETKTGDIARSAANLQFFAEFAAHEHSETYRGDGGVEHTSLREPLGVVGLITPWNLPLYLATWKIAPALMAGNTVILKPAELTPLTAMAFAKLAEKAGVPPGVFNVVQGFGAESAGEYLVTHPDVQAISFTGETSTGQHIMRAASPTLKKLSFELGGKGATVIFPDADLERATTDAVRAAFRNQGQICLAGSRLLVHRNVYSEVLERVVARIQDIKIGDPLDARTTMGSLISREHRDRVLGFIERASRLSGVELLLGGDIPGGMPVGGAYLSPTLLTGVEQHHEVVQKEVFGPVLTVQAFDTEDEALQLLNGTEYGLSCSLFTKDLALARRMADGADTGLVWVNTWFARDLHTAFGGKKKSGVGREGGRFSLDFFSDYKTISVSY